MSASGPASSERFVLRAWRPTDAPRLLDIRSRWEIARWLAEPPEVMTELAQAQRKITEWQQRYDETDGRCGVWAIQDRGTGVVAGSVSLGRMPGGTADDVEIGWMLHPDAQGRGLAREAAAALLQYAFERGLPDVHAFTHVENVASQQVCRAIGLHDEGVVRDTWYAGDSQQFRLTREQYGQMWTQALQPNGRAPGESEQV